MFLPTAVYSIGGGIWELTTFGQISVEAHPAFLHFFFFERFASASYGALKVPAITIPS